MPNWCYNRVTAYGNEDKLKEIEKIFESKTPFNDIFPMPDFKTIPNENGELPKLEQMKNPDGSIIWETYKKIIKCLKVMSAYANAALVTS